jgi:hypothetical protein
MSVSEPTQGNWPKASKAYKQQTALTLTISSGPPPTPLALSSINYVTFRKRKETRCNTYCNPLIKGYSYHKTLHWSSPSLTLHLASWRYGRSKPSLSFSFFISSVYAFIFKMNQKLLKIRPSARNGGDSTEDIPSKTQFSKQNNVSTPKSQSFPEPSKIELLFDGHYYDVTDWIKRHPGGDIIKLYTESGEDATVAVQQFHLRTLDRVMKIMKVLPKRPVDSVPSKFLLIHDFIFIKSQIIY